MQCDNFLCEGKDVIAVSNTFCIAWFIFHSSIPWSGELGLPEIIHLQNELMHMWATNLWENQNFCQPGVTGSPEVACSVPQSVASCFCPFCSCSRCLWGVSLYLLSVFSLWLRACSCEGEHGFQKYTSCYKALNMPNWEAWVEWLTSETKARE